MQHLLCTCLKLDFCELGPACRLEEFLKELPVAIKRAEPCLADVFETTVPLERRLMLRELQTSFVYTTVLAKKIKVGWASLDKSAGLAILPAFRFYAFADPSIHQLMQCHIHAGSVQKLF